MRRVRRADGHHRPGDDDARPTRIASSGTSSIDFERRDQRGERQREHPVLLRHRPGEVLGEPERSAEHAHVGGEDGSNRPRPSPASRRARPPGAAYPAPTRIRMSAIRSGRSLKISPLRVLRPSSTASIPSSRLHNSRSWMHAAATSSSPARPPGLQPGEIDERGRGRQREGDPCNGHSVRAYPAAGQDPGNGSGPVRVPRRQHAPRPGPAQL